ncbi:MAG: hypothetical protein FJ263_00930 [Planctomycetes bacterium]|nr:hypothetical protein [Planctomycetota bacterium]
MKEKKLSPKQKLFLADFTGGNYSVFDLLERHKIRRSDYRRWLGEMLFVDEMNARIESSRQNSQIRLAQSAPAAAEKLAKLAESDGETGRKACLDILKLSVQDGEDKTIAAPTVEISDEQAEKILEFMAGGQAIDD